MCRTKAQSSSTINRYIYRGNHYAKSIYSIKPLSREEDIPDTKLHIRNKSPPKGYYAQAYKLGDPPPTGYREGIKNTGATTIISKKPVQRQQSAAKATEDRGPPI